MRPTVTMHVVSSLDGFIARKDNSVSWMDSSGVYERGVTDDGTEDIQSIDCYVLGSRTYEHALQLGWPYGDTPTIVVTHRTLPSTRASVEFYSGDLKRLMDEILTPRHRNIWVVGGAVLCQSFLRLGLVDEIRLMIAPVLLGNGLHLFGDRGAERRRQLKNAVAFRNGFVELSYSRQSTNS
jgi:dihydrofolate reductase